MFGRHGTLWQATLAAGGLVIVGLVLLAPRGRDAARLVEYPSAAVSSAAPRAAHAGQAPSLVQVPVQAGDTQSSGQQAGDDPAAGAASSDPAASAPDVSSPVQGAADRVAGAAGAAPMSPAAATTVRTLFTDGFESDPLKTGLPPGWLLGDPKSSGGSLPILGSLLGGLTGSGSNATGLPSAVLDGSHVLARAGGAWSHLAAGPVLTDYSTSSQVKVSAPAQGFAGVAGRFVDADNFVACGIRDGGSLQLLQVVNGRQQVLSTVPAAVASGAFHTVTMQLQGGVATCALDGTQMIDSTGVTQTAGRIGLIALGEVSAEFDNVTATTLG